MWGELLAGIILGPSLLGGVQIYGYNLVVVNETVRAFAELGAILLLFLVGLETQFAEFRKTGALSAR